MGEALVFPRFPPLALCFASTVSLIPAFWQFSRRSLLPAPDKARRRPLVVFFFFLCGQRIQLLSFGARMFSRGVGVPAVFFCLFVGLKPDDA